MSITSGPINETEQAGERLADHVTDHIGQDAPTVFRQLLNVLAEFRLVLGIERKS